ncbi:merozoite 31 kDa surface antigen-like [Ochotona princeps]|uniref:merozoite 31 kDa surface antigen-like n=1 Tax=Ochotona princeps TaxID=9978 RepID=UPI0027151516|nr:merozoite 31 kDa surface antigen-like [Ochotona princeps]
MATGVQMLVTTTAVLVLRLSFAAAGGDVFSKEIQTLTCKSTTGSQREVQIGADGEVAVLTEGHATLPGSKIKLECPARNHTFDPELQSLGGKTEDKKRIESVYVDLKINTSEPLQTAIRGATGTTDGAPSNDNTTVTLTFPQLPNTQNTIYIRCKPTTAGEPLDTDSADVGGDAKKVCVFAVTVTPPLPQGPQSCAVPGSVVLGIPGEGDTTQFSCGSEMKLSQTDEKKVYSNDCIT